MMQRISFNSIVPPVIPTHQLAFRILYSYLRYKGIGQALDIRFNLFGTDVPDETIAEKILSQETDLAAFSVFTWNAVNVGEICRRIKMKNPAVWTVLGGPYASHRADQYISRGHSDLIVKGAGEDVFCRVLTRIRQDGNDFSDIPNLVYQNNQDTVETSEDHSFDVSRQQYPLSVEVGDSEMFYYETSRGCPFRCRFCCWSISGRHLRWYPREKIKKDLESIFDLSYVKNLALVDSDLFHNKRHGLWVLRQIQALNETRRQNQLPEIKFLFETNPELVDDEIIDEIFKHPSQYGQVSCGLQTFDGYVSNHHLARRFHQDTYVENLKRMIERARETWRHDITKRNIAVEIIYGLPGDTYEGFKRTLEFLLSEIRTDSMFIFRFQVLPGSYFWEHAADYRLVFNEQPPHDLISSSTFSKADMDNAHRLVFFVYLFMTFLKGVMRVVDKKMEKGHIGVYEKIIEHIGNKYPGFVATLYEPYENCEDIVDFFMIIGAYLSDKKYLKQRYDIIQDARRIVQNHVRKARIL